MMLMMHFRENFCVFDHTASYTTKNKNILIS